MAFWRAKYGEETTSTCPLCSRPAIVRNSQGVAVCTDHKNATIDGKCPSCHAALELRDGRFGKFFLCVTCGPVSMKKASFEKPTTAAQRANVYKNSDGTDKFIRSDDPRFEFR